MPNDHVRALVELLRPCGPDLARRWLSALTLVPADERAALVQEVERRIVETYPSPRFGWRAPGPAPDDAEVTVVHPPVARPGYVEQVHVTYARVRKDADEGAQKSKKTG